MPKIYDFIKKTVSVVLVGGFNSLMHTPDWLLHFNLINADDHKNSKVEVLSTNQIITILPWCNIQVAPASQEEYKLVITLTDEVSFSIFSDLVYSLIELNDTTVFSALGINFSRQIQHESTEIWHAWGHRLAPTKVWEKAFSDNDEMKHCGMRGISMRIDSILEPTEEIKDENTILNIQITPILQSLKDTNGENITDINLNYHFPINREHGAVMVQETLGKYLEELNQEVEGRIDTLITG